MKVRYSEDKLHTCDNCKKLIKKWEVHQLVDRSYSPGENFDKCSGNIKTCTYKIVELCLDCMNEVWEIYGKNREAMKNE